MKIPIIITSARGKTKKQLVDETMKAIENYLRVEKEALKELSQKSPQEKKS